MGNKQIKDSCYDEDVREVRNILAVFCLACILLTFFPLGVLLRYCLAACCLVYITFYVVSIVKELVDYNEIDASEYYNSYLDISKVKEITREEYENKYMEK